MRSTVGMGGSRITSGWSVLATAKTTAPLPPSRPAVPTGLMASAGMNFIQWRWNPVPGADGYDIQFSTTEMFSESGDAVALPAERTSYLAEDLEPETSYYFRVRSTMGMGGSRITSGWSMLATAKTTAPASPREMPHMPLDVSRGQLERLFDEIIDKTERREAFSEVKENAMNFSALEEMKALGRNSSLRRAKPNSGTRC